MSTGSTGGYPVPDEGFNALEHARNKILRANQFQQLVLQQWLATYEDFYGLQPGGGSRYTTAQMQAVIDAMPAATARDIIQDSGAFVAFVNQAAPGAIADKYQSPAFEMTDDGATITVGDLKPAWQQPETVTDGNTVG
jgi:hypothetical protein